MRKINLEKLNTESINQQTKNIDKLSTQEILKIINEEDSLVSEAVKEKLDEINLAVELILNAIKNHGRVFYLGAGSSGRIGVLDASEMLPTYNSDDIFKGIIAGGDFALRNPIEGAEDDFQMGMNDLIKNNFQTQDILFVISASGRTPYCLGALNYANKINAKSIGLSMVKNSEFKKLSDVNIEILTRAEVISGSTRMKAGTATKMVLNMISTTTMIKLNKVYGNLMIDVRPSNEKLVNRCFNIIKKITKADDLMILETMKLTNNDVRTSVVMILKNVNQQQAADLIAKENNLRKILEN